MYYNREEKAPKFKNKKEKYALDTRRKKIAGMQGFFLNKKFCGYVALEMVVDSLETCTRGNRAACYIMVTSHNMKIPWKPFIIGLEYLYIYKYKKKSGDERKKGPFSLLYLFYLFPLSLSIKFVDFFTTQIHIYDRF